MISAGAARAAGASGASGASGATGGAGASGASGASGATGGAGGAGKAAGPTRRAELVEIYTDGACRGNPGPGGWAAILRVGGREKEISGAETHTTNNRMELKAAIAALQALKRPVHVKLFTDSQYLRNGVLAWLKQWKARGWKTSDKKAVKNRDLWELLDEEAGRHRIEWHWVRGHSGHVDNERCDALANAAIDELLAVDSRAAS